jgi:tetratricopeptide (TPR) repeat protein
VTCLVPEPQSEEILSDIQVELQRLRLLEKDQSEEQLKELHQQSMDLKRKGNVAYTIDKKYEEASSLYSEALQLLPSSYTRERAVLLNNLCAVKGRLIPEEQTFSKPEDHPCMNDLNAAIELSPTYVSPYYKRAAIYRKCGDEHLDQALTDYKKVIELNELTDLNTQETEAIVVELERQIQDRNERMKAEMFSKLKDLGNVCLKPFGLSTNNFQLESNESGGYSIKFNP